MIKRFFTEKETTAYHEAGHATMAYLKKVRLIKITIVASEQENALGSLVYSNKLIAEDEQELFAQKNIERLQSFIMVAFGGLAAEYIYTGFKNIAAANADLQYIEQIVDFIHQEPTRKEELLTNLLQQTIDTLQVSDHWQILENLAQYLIRQSPTLSGQEALQILKKSSTLLAQKELINLTQNKIV